MLRSVLTSATSLLFLIACHGNHQSNGQDSTSTKETADSNENHPCGDAVPPSIANDSWSAAGDVPGGGILTFAQGQNGSPLYAGSHNSGLWSSTDLGHNWLLLPVDTTHTTADVIVSPADPQVLYRSSGGLLKRSDDGGQHWTDTLLGDISASGSNMVYAIAVAPYDSNRVYVITDKGYSYVSTDSGASFTTLAQLSVGLSGDGMDPFNNHAWHILPDIQAGGRVIFTDSHSLWTSDDGLVTWQSRFTSPVGGHSLIRDPLNAEHLLLGATDGLLESWDEGSTWSQRNDVGTELELSAWSQDGSWLAYASADQLYLSHDNGHTWTSKSFDWIENGALAIIGQRLIMSWDNGVVVSDDQGDTWQNDALGLHDAGMSVVATDPVCPNRVFIGSRCTGGMYSSDDYGSTWTHVDSYFHYVMGIHFDPNFPDTVWSASDDAIRVSYDDGVTWNDSWVKYHFHGFAVNPDDSDTLLSGSVGSGDWADSSMQVYRSTNGGNTWAASSGGIPESEASAHTIVYWPGDTNTVILGTYKGEDPSHLSGDGIGAFVSNDGGLSWTQAALPEINIAYLAVTENGVVAATGDGLYRSFDKGISWTKLEGPTGYMLSVDFKGQLGLALSQAGQVWRTDDGGNTWRELDTGLARNETSFLDQIAISEDSAYAWVTVYNVGMFRIALQ